MRAARLILHIGEEKTGSTSLQDYLLTNRETLQKSGISVCPVPPERLWEQLYASFNQAQSQAKATNVIEDSFLKDFLEWLDDAREHNRIIVISSEHFSSRFNSVESLDYLKGIFLHEDYGISVYCYVRPIVESVASQFSTHLRGSGSKTFKQFLNQPISVRVKQRDPYRPRWDHLYLSEIWCEVFGKNNVHFREYNRAFLKDKDLLADFFDWTELTKPDDAIISRDKNTALTPLSGGLIAGVNWWRERAEAAKNNDAERLLGFCKRVVNKFQLPPRIPLTSLVENCLDGQKLVREQRFAKQHGLSPRFAKAHYPSHKSARFYFGQLLFHLSRSIAIGVVAVVVWPLFRLRARGPFTAKHL